MISSTLTFLTIFLSSLSSLCSATPIITEKLGQDISKRDVPLDVTKTNLCKTNVNNWCMFSTFHRTASGLTDVFAFDWNCNLLGWSDGATPNGAFSFTVPHLPYPITVNTGADGVDHFKYIVTTYEKGQILGSCFANSLADGTAGQTCQYIFGCHPGSEGEPGAVKRGLSELEVLKTELSERGPSELEVLEPELSERGLDVTTTNLCNTATLKLETDQCVLSTFTATGANSMDYYLFDHNCILIGWSNDHKIGAEYNLASELPKYVTVLADQTYPKLWYEGHGYLISHRIDNSLTNGQAGLSYQMVFTCSYTHKRSLPEPEVLESDLSERNIAERDSLIVTSLDMCHQWADGNPGQCYIGTFANFNAVSVDLYAFDSNCKLLGWTNNIPQQASYNFAGQLPHPITVNTADLLGTGVTYGGHNYLPKSCFYNSVDNYATWGNTCQFMVPCSG